MRRERKTEADAWISLGWLCRDLGVALVNCPDAVLNSPTADVGATVGQVFARVGVDVCTLRGAAGLGIIGLSVVRYTIPPGGSATWVDTGIAAPNRRARATWADLVDAIEVARATLALQKALTR